MEDDNYSLSCKSVKQIKYTTEEINKCIIQSKNQTDLLKYYMDYIKNYKELTKDMLENIKFFDDSSKMKLIEEFNVSIKNLNILLS